MITFQPKRECPKGILYAYNVELSGSIYYYLSHHETPEINHISFYRYTTTIEDGDLEPASYDDLDDIQNYLSQSGYPI